jgi:hypothetical protein
MTNFLKLIPLAFLALCLATGCGKDPEPKIPEVILPAPEPPVEPEPKPPVEAVPFPPLEETQWKLVGIVDTLTGAVRDLEPKDSEWSYTLVFDSDSTARGKIVMNSFLLSLGNNRIMEVNPFYEEEPDAIFLSEFIMRGIYSYEYVEEKTELRFFNEDKDQYLLYQPKPKPEPVPLPPVEQPPFPTLEGSRWKLVGIIDASTGAVRELAPKDCATCYMLTFDTDNTADMRSKRNTIRIHLKGGPEGRLAISFTLVGETGADAGVLYHFAGTLRSYEYRVTRSSDAEGKWELRFFNEQKDQYLLYRPEPPIEEPSSPFPPLAGTQWKLAGIVNTATGVLAELEPKDCATCYTLTFDTDSTAEGTSIMNTLNLGFGKREDGRYYAAIVTTKIYEEIPQGQEELDLFYRLISGRVSYEYRAIRSSEAGEQRELRFFNENPKYSNYYLQYKLLQP